MKIRLLFFIVALVIPVQGSSGQFSTNMFGLTREKPRPTIEIERPFPPPPPVPLRTNFKGVNIAGADVAGGKLNAVMNRDYMYPQSAEIDYFAAKGFGLIRLPFDLTRTYPVAYAQLNGNQLAEMKRVIDQASSLGVRVLLDPHWYGHIYDDRIGRDRLIGIDPEGTRLFADFWKRMAIKWKDYPNVMFGLMNEPNEQTAAEWKLGAVAAIDAIASVTTDHIITVPGTFWTDAWAWVLVGNAAVWQGYKPPPRARIVFEIHQYLDDDSSGTHAACTVGVGSSRLDAVTAWAEQNGFQLILGEFGWSTDPTCDKEKQTFMDYMTIHSNVWKGWTYWASGAFYAGYMFTAQPSGLGTASVIDAPPMPTLLNNLR